MLNFQNLQNRFRESEFGSKLINVQKIFWLLVLFETLIIGLIWYADYSYDITVLYYFIGIICVPLVIFVTPIEPTLGVVIVIITSGLDILAIITKTDTGHDTELRLTYFHFALMLLIVSTVLNLLLRRRTMLPSLSLWLPLVMMTVVYCFSLIYTPAFFFGAVQFVRVFALSLICFVVILTINSPNKIYIVTFVMLVTALSVSILTLYQLFTQGSFFAPLVVKVATVMGLPVYRSTGTFSNPNKLAAFLMIGVIISFGLVFIKELKPLIKFFLILIFLVTSLGLASSFSRGGWVAAIIGLMVVVYYHRKWNYLWYFLGLLIVAILVISIKVPQLWAVVFERFGSIFTMSDASSSARISLIRSAIWMWQDHPILGVGLRGFPELYYDYIDPLMPHYLADVRESHALQAEILSEQGLVGFTISIWLFLTILIHGIRSIKIIKNIYIKNIQIAFVALYVAYIVSFAISTDINNNLFWVTIGMIYAIPLAEHSFSAASTENI